MLYGGEKSPPFLYALNLRLRSQEKNCLHIMNIEVQILKKEKGRNKMERNENGYPRSNNRNPDNQGCVDRGILGADRGEECPESNEATLFDKPLAYAYVPIQRWRMLHSIDEALGKGTLFEELYKPMEVYGNE